MTKFRVSVMAFSVGIAGRRGSESGRNERRDVHIILLSKEDPHSPSPSLSKEQLAEVEYLLGLEKVKHDKAMDEKLVAHGKWLDNKTEKWLTCFQKVWVEAAYNKAALFAQMKNEVTNKKLGTLQYATALFVGGVGAAASVANWLFE